MNKVSAAGAVLAGLCIVGYVVCRLFSVDPGNLLDLAALLAVGAGGVAVKST